MTTTASRKKARRSPTNEAGLDDGGSATPAEQATIATGAARQVNDVEFLGREAVLELLGVRKETLYTYVSRGLIKTVAQPGLKTKLYRKSDVEKLKTRAVARSDVPRVSHSLRYGAPIAPTWITEITPQGPRYRGHLATDLAIQGRSFESAAELLWGGILTRRPAPWPLSPLPARTVAWLADSVPVEARPPSALRQFALIATSLSAVEDSHADSQSLDTPSGRRLLQAFAGVAGYLGRTAKYCALKPGESVAACVARGLGVARDEHVVALIDAALVLSADHELSAPTFAARICASTGADLPACVAAALMAQSGPMQIGGVSDVEALLESLEDVATSPAPAQAGLPCFNHPLYDRDPRAVVLLAIAKRHPRLQPIAQRAFRLVDDAERSGQYPNAFAALAIASAAVGLPKGSAALLHTLGRTAGWIAHAVEQRLAGAMLRPRAKYLGPLA